MSGLGRKIMSAFLEVTPTPPKATGNPENDSGKKDPEESRSTYPREQESHAPADSRFTEYFDKLFSEANIPGPDYYEFSKMIGAMQAIANEQSRYNAAYAGLNAQGVSKEKLLSTAGEYLRILEADARQFHTTVDTAMQEKVQSKKVDENEKNERIQALSREISDLQNQILALQKEIKENEEKIEASTGGYMAENVRRAARIQADIEKINQYLQ